MIFQIHNSFERSIEPSIPTRAPESGDRRKTRDQFIISIIANVSGATWRDNPKSRQLIYEVLIVQT